MRAHTDEYRAQRKHSGAPSGAVPASRDSRCNDARLAPGHATSSRHRHAGRVGLQHRRHSVTQDARRQTRVGQYVDLASVSDTIRYNTTSRRIRIVFVPPRRIVIQLCKFRPPEIEKCTLCPTAAPVTRDSARRYRRIVTRDMEARQRLRRSLPRPRENRTSHAAGSRAVVCDTPGPHDLVRVS